MWVCALDPEALDSLELGCLQWVLNRTQVLWESRKYYC